METKTINTVAITGAGSGLGLELAIGYAKQGYKVFGTVISPIKIEAQKNELAAFDIIPTVTDINNEEDVRNWSGIVASTLGEKGLDIKMKLFGFDTIRE